MSKLEEMFHQACRMPSDINLHLPTLMNLVDDFVEASDEGRFARVVELGTRHGLSTIALLMGQPQWVKTYDIDPKWDDFKRIQDAWSDHVGEEHREDLQFLQENSLTCEIPECDILFIDTLHTGEQLTSELGRHHKKVKHYLAFHDLVSFGLQDEAPVRRHDKWYHPGLVPAIFEFLSLYPEWKVFYWDSRCNGLLVLKRMAQ